MVRNQEKKIFERTKIEPFDVIDSLNWVLIQRNTTQNLLIEHSLTIICNTPIERSESIMTKMLNTFLKSTQIPILRNWRSPMEKPAEIQKIIWVYVQQIRTISLISQNYDIKLLETRQYEATSIGLWSYSQSYWSNMQ
jgi:hypothetical protein